MIPDSGIAIPHSTKLATSVAWALPCDGSTPATSAPTPEAITVDAMGSSWTAVIIFNESNWDFDILIWGSVNIT
ncbi:hypothetical protein N7486_009182 [Penicillium sp. IBT 16267x]|nr:hypothetical protein N7486_009182 [Penicillium sp. IBT 16267x]